MRSRATRVARAAWPAALLAASLAAAGVVVAAADRPPSGSILTGAYLVTPPRAPWKRVRPFDEAGRVMYHVPGSRGVTTELTITYLAVADSAPQATITGLLESERAALRSETDGSEAVERSSFRADSMVADGWAWRGFRVDVKSDLQQGTSWRWFALHPEFPRLRRVLRLAFDEYVPGARPPTPSRLADARAFASGVRASGAGWTGPLAEAFVDARAATFAARIDSSMRLCWSSDPDAGEGRHALGIGLGLAIDGDFFELSPQAPRGGLVDADATEYGTAFDRNRDGRYDLVILNRGVRAFEGQRLLPTVAAVADDDFDGTIDCAVIENADFNEDGTADHRLYVRDANGDRAVDQAILFRDAPQGPDAKTLPVKDGLVTMRLAGRPPGALAFDQVFGLESDMLARLDRARAGCGGR